MIALFGDGPPQLGVAIARGCHS